MSNWITAGIIKSIKFRDDLYKTWKMSTYDSPDYSILGHDLKPYNEYLKQCIWTAKKEFYMRELTKYKNDIRKTWDTLKHILNKKMAAFDITLLVITSKEVIVVVLSLFSSYFTNILNDYFVGTGPSYDWHNVNDATLENE